MTGSRSNSSFASTIPETCEDALKYLYTLRRWGTHLGLERISALLDALHRPDATYKAIHIAGTNGKGSTANFCAEILKNSGARVGLFTSPHILNFNERISVNGHQITNEEILKSLRTVVHAIDSLPDDLPGEHPTFFETITALAAVHFADNKCTHVIWETGMGGRLDATNAVHKDCAVITNVSFDHTQWLGDTIELIAREKAGIITSKIPVISAAQENAAKKEIREACNRQKTSIVWVCDDKFTKDVLHKQNESVEAGESHIQVLPYHNKNITIKYNDTIIENIHLKTPGDFQATNAACAIAAVSYILENKPLCTDENYVISIKNALSTCTLQARLQKISKKPEIFLDVAHNPTAFNTLISSLSFLRPENRKVLCLGLLKDKDISAILTCCSQYFDEIWYTPPTSERTLECAPFIKYCDILAIPKDTIRTCNTVIELLSNIHTEKENEMTTYIIAGSFYLAHDVLSCIEEHDNKRSEIDLSDPVYIRKA